MCDLQCTIEFAVELFKFYNVDLFQRGIYQVRCALRVATKLKVEVEVEAPELNTGLGTINVIGSYGASHPFQILYRNEEISLKEVVVFRCHVLLNGHNLRENLERIEFSLVLELWFSEASNMALSMVSSRTLQLNMSPIQGLHYHLPVLFDYFHLSAVSITIHAALIALHPPYINAPKTPKSWSKSNFTLLTSHYPNEKMNWRSAEVPKIHSQTYEILKEAHQNLKSIISEYKFLLMDNIHNQNLLYEQTYNVIGDQKLPPTLNELCKENIKLWNYFLINLSHKTLIQQHLSKKHHNLRIQRFSELFLLNRNPRYSAMECSDQKYVMIADLLRRSKYLTSLPPLPVHCSALDGEPATIPIIFEDQYQTKYDFGFKNFKRNEALISKYNNVSPYVGKECSCNKNNIAKYPIRVKLNANNLPTSECFESFKNCSSSARHSKSLDHLQLFPPVSFQRSFTTINKDFEFAQNNCDFNSVEKAESIQNIYPEATFSKYLFNKTLSEEILLQGKSPQTNQNDFSKNKMRSSLKHRLRANMESTTKRRRKTESAYKPFIIKNFQNVKYHCQKLVKSISHNVSSESSQNIFRSNSMQLNFLCSKINNNFNNYVFNADKRELSKQSSDVNKCYPQKFPLESNEENSIYNSFNNVSIYKDIIENNGSPNNCSEFNRSLSVPCLAKQKSVTTSQCVSLPDLTTKIEHCAQYGEINYYSDSSTSERSGWVSSPSQSESSSVISNLIEETFGVKNNIFEEKKNIVDVYFNASKNVESKFVVNGTSSNCKVINEEPIQTLPPPKEFRDTESPIVSFPLNAEITDVANIICNLTEESRKRKKACNPYEQKRNAVFEKAKCDFKYHLTFPGVLYSDLSVKSTIPYFHISDEFRMFSPQGMHLVICVHGLDGNSADLRLVKTYLELGLPGAYLDFLMSERNQGDTFSDFDTMTDRLISEILHYLDTCAIRPTRISFVGHSLGNIIIRSALTRPEMKFVLPRLHTFLSLSGPHLGTLYNNSGLVNMGMWFMQKWKKSGSLLQLCLKDASDYRNSFLYRLSQKGSLHHFKNILLCGSGQDRYVPLHSARIELCKEALKDPSDLGAVYREMVHNILCPILADDAINFVRYDIHHALPNTANTLIGRAAHIAVLDSELFIEKFMTVAGIKYFR